MRESERESEREKEREREQREQRDVALNGDTRVGGRSAHASLAQNVPRGGMDRYSEHQYRPKAGSPNTRKRKQGGKTSVQHSALMTNNKEISGCSRERERERGG